MEEQSLAEQKMELVVTLSCADRPGIVNALTKAIFELGGNIVENQQYTDSLTNTFVMRTCFTANNNYLDTKEKIAKALKDFQPNLGIRETSRKKKALVLVTKEPHCLLDFFYLHDQDELDFEIVGVVSNRADLGSITTSHGFKFHHFPIDSSNLKSKAESEAKIDQLIMENGIDFIILARYMQILSPEFCAKYPGRIINIHHSFLPGFKGAKPYHQAHARGVKLIGATAHFVTSDLDEGPIIDQDVEGVTHSLTPAEYVAIGRDIEHKVLTRSAQNFAQDRIFIVGNRTVVFKK